MSTPAFTMDNTQGYSQEKLDILNRDFAIRRDRLEAELGRKLNPSDTYDGSFLDHISERLLVEFDAAATLPLLSIDEMGAHDAR